METLNDLHTIFCTVAMKPQSARTYLNIYPHNIGKAKVNIGS